MSEHYNFSMSKASSAVALCGVVVAAMAAVAHAEDLPHAGEVNQATDQLAQKRSIPQPATIDRAEYQIWKAALTKKQRAKLNAFCRRYHRDYLMTCNGYGETSAPMFPQVSALMVPLPRGGPTTGTSPAPDPDQLLREYKASLTQAQKRYLAKRCKHAKEPEAVGEGDPACFDMGTPLVISFAETPVQFTSGGAFDLWPGVTMKMSWPTAATPWLALDRNGNGRIDDGSELFGSGTKLPSGAFAANGFAALAVFDENADSIIDANDSVFNKLLLWADNGDQVSQAFELTPASGRLQAIGLDFDRLHPRCDTSSNCEVERAATQWRAADGSMQTGAVIDIHVTLRVAE